MLTNVEKSGRQSGDARRAEAVRVALELIGKFGPDAVTTTAIARQMGVAQTALFKHFPNKEAIWIAATDTIGETIAARMQAIDGQPAPPLEKLRRILIGYVALAHEIPAIAAFLCHRSGSDGAARLCERVTERFARFRQVVAALVCQAAADGTLRDDADPALVAQLCVALVQAALISGPNEPAMTMALLGVQIEGLFALACSSPP